ncbi:MAG: asparagine synthase (glutamine-hydrolyzing) [Alphaproteobacteria bacterium]
MCGITGFIGRILPAESEQIIRSMCDALAHRGPDGEGTYVTPQVALGHRRLAILDLTDAGAQPMTTADGRLTIVLNGEIYNFLELRRELEAKGYSFHSRSDTEVVLYAYDAWGEKALTKLNGMFAFAIWDNVSHSLLLVRDRYGIKPLYYTVVDGMVAFASEVKAFFRLPGFRVEMDRKGLLEYLTFQNFFTPRTLFSGVQMLPAGSRARIHAGAPDAIEIKPYWDFNFEEPARPAKDAYYLETFLALFEQAVQRQLVSDVPVNSYLSGGMDSGGITAIAARRLPYMKTFTVGFDMSSASGMEISFDERAQAERMSALFKTEHYEMVLKAGDMERCMRQLVWHLEEPRVGQSYPNYYAAKLASKFGKVVLAGTGGDELFGGYPWRYYRTASSANFDDFVERYYAHWQRLIPNRTIQQVFAPIWNDVSDVWTMDIFKDTFHTHKDNLKKPEDYVNSCLYLEAKTFLHGLLTVEDKMSMAFGLESRVPFLDNDLVDFAQKVPMHLKVGQLKKAITLNENLLGDKKKAYFAKTHDGKLIARKAMQHLMPKEITGAVKQGFSAPDASWFKGESIEYVRTKLMTNQARIYDYLDRKTVQRLIRDHLNGKENRRLFIWSMLYLEEWFDLFLSGSQLQKATPRQWQRPTHHVIHEGTPSP